MSKTQAIYSLDTDHYTVHVTDDYGTRDLNAYGEPLRSLEELAVFVRELCTQGAYSVATEAALLAEIEDATEKRS